MKMFLQVPYETLNKRFRAAQKNIDREASHVTMVVAELEKTLSNFPVVDSVVSLLDGVVEKLSALKRKVSSRHVQTHVVILILIVASFWLSWKWSSFSFFKVKYMHLNARLIEVRDQIKIQHHFLS